MNFIFLGSDISKQEGWGTERGIGTTLIYMSESAE